MKQLPVLFLCLSEACVDEAIGSHRGLYVGCGVEAVQTTSSGRDLCFCCPHGLGVCGRRQRQAGRPPTFPGNHPGKVHTTSSVTGRLFKRRRNWRKASVLRPSQFIVYTDIQRTRLFLIPTWYFFVMLKSYIVIFFLLTALQILIEKHAHAHTHTRTHKGVVPLAFFGRGEIYASELPMRIQMSLKL